MTGKVIKSTGSWYLVKKEDGTKVECRIRGIFRIKDLNLTNPIAVGDNVIFEIEGKDKTGSIIEIQERKNYFIRKAASGAKQFHIIAANIDQAFLVVSLTTPKTPTGFIDRFLLTTETYNVPAQIIFNKSDIYDSHHLKIIEQLAHLYEKVGYPCYITSAKTGENIKDVKTQLANKVSLFAGNSGVGKSAILNVIYPELNLKTADISNFSGKGVHTTSHVEMFEFQPNSFLIDTPGIRELGIANIEPYEISHFFPEMRKLIGSCRYNNCRHINEPKCAVKEALENGEIHDSRYASYVNIVTSHEE